MKICVSLALCCASHSVWAQPTATEFPGDAANLTAANLQELLTGKVYNVKLPDSSSWRLDFRANGTWFINTSSGYNDTGKWSVEEGKLCTAPNKSKAACNEVRKQGDALLLKRDNGTVVPMTVQN